MAMALGHVEEQRRQRPEEVGLAVLVQGRAELAEAEVGLGGLEVRLGPVVSSPRSAVPARRVREAADRGSGDERNTTKQVQVEIG